MKILLEDNSIIAVYKEAGLATQTASLAGRDLVSELKNYLAREQGKKEPYLAVINRLDQPVEGIVMFAKNEKSAAALSRQLQTGQMKKQYQALVYGQMPDKKGQLTDYMCKDSKNNCSRITSPSAAGARKAILKYQVLGAKEHMQLLKIELLTGRHHQIRLQLSSRQHPLLGDQKYGSQESMDVSEKQGCKQIGLCADSLIFLHPDTGKELQIQAVSQNPIIQEMAGGMTEHD